MTNIIIDLLKVLIIVTTIGTVISFYPARASSEACVTLLLMDE